MIAEAGLAALWLAGAMALAQLALGMLALTRGRELWREGGVRVACLAPASIAHLATARSGRDDCARRSRIPACSFS